MNLTEIILTILLAISIIAIMFHNTEILSLRDNLDDIIKEYKNDKRDKNPRSLSQYDDFIYNNIRYSVAFTNDVGIIPDIDKTCYEIIPYEDLLKDGNFKIVYRH